MPDWIERPIHEAIYKIEQSIAQVTWGFDRSGLLVIDLIDRFRHGLVTQGFTTALDQVATSTIGISRPVFELALVVFLLCIIAMPVVSFRWINLKKAMFLFFVIPIGLPLLAGGFQDIDAARGELGATFYANIYTRANFDMLPDDMGGNGTVSDMGELTDFSNERDGYTGVRGVDVAAAYLYARRQDVFNPSASLPEDFKQRYFFLDVGEFEGKSKNERWDQISTSADGITRTVYGLILILFAFLEALVNLGFTLTLGFLLIAFMISLLFAYFSLFEGMAISILKKLADLFLQSWSISAVQALVLAALVKVATSGNGIAVLGMGLLALGIQMMFVTVAWNAVLTAVTGFGTSGGLIPSEANRALMKPTVAAGELANQGVRASKKVTKEAIHNGQRVAGFAIAGAALLTSRRRTPDTLASSMGAPSGADKATASAYQRGSINTGINTGSASAATAPNQPGDPGQSSAAPPPASSGAAAQPAALRKLASSLRRYPLPEVTAQALVLDTRQRGAFSPLRRAGLVGHLSGEYGLSPQRANRHADVLQGRMQRVSRAGPQNGSSATALLSAPASQLSAGAPPWLNEQPPISAYNDAPPASEEG
ncbi:MAG: hypothetical protein H0T53_05745 [Herpetosiphonaceae bacterium]|nr:hypothetical protein [Herpetosiphonaceae bacterium]